MYLNRVSPLMAPRNFSFEINLQKSLKMLIYSTFKKTNLFVSCH